MYKEKYKDCLEYIDSYWDKIIIEPHDKPRWRKQTGQITRRKMFQNIIDVPNAFITPNDNYFSRVFYWDTFFMFKGLIRTEREWILKEMVENFIYLFQNFGVIPNFNSPASTGRSQPPFFTSMILDTYNGPYFEYLRSGKVDKLLFQLQRTKEWLKETSEIAKQEYFSVWDDEKSLFNHKVAKLNLNRYGDRDAGYAHSSELESGWDFTSRFYNRCNNFLPIDLNVYLFKYERDFGKIAFHLEDGEEEKAWKDRAAARREKINDLMWDEKTGFFFDYDYVNKKRSEFLSLAGFTPLWAGLATKDQSERMVKNLKDFENNNGLLITAKESLAPMINLSEVPVPYRNSVEYNLKPKQWDYPHIWPPLEYLTVIGLLKYGFVEDAKRIMEKSLKAEAKIFRKYKTFFEKIDGVDGDQPESFLYPNQSGFGWTNAVFYRYVMILDALETGENIYTEPKSTKPPYRISIPH